MSTRGYYSRGINMDADAKLAVGAGKIPGAHVENMVARGVNIPVGSFNIVSPIAAITTGVLPSDTGELIDIVSDSASDVGNEVRIDGLDTAFQTQTETVVLTGTTPVSTTKLFTRINYMVVLFTPIIGEVQAQRSSDSAAVSGISPEDQRSLVAIHTFPAGHGTQFLSLNTSMIRDAGGANSESIVIQMKAANINRVPTMVFAFALEQRGSSSQYFEDPIPIQHPGPIDVYFEAEASAADMTLFGALTALSQKNVV